ncbi:MAG TPA: hypothetical protein VN873_01750 [Candidatus Angelobacter sp.]|nr:hypothetical protein [Candidatus Angelobacter sp.]
MKKLSLVVLLGLALSAVVSGCNQNSGSDNTASTNAAPAAPSTNGAH